MGEGRRTIDFVEIKHKVHHLLKARITKLIIILALVIYGYLGYKMNKPYDWYADRLILLGLAYGFRRALGRI